MVEHTFHPNTLEAERQRDLCEFEASHVLLTAMVYTFWKGNGGGVDGRGQAVGVGQRGCRGRDWEKRREGKLQSGHEIDKQINKSLKNATQGPMRKWIQIIYKLGI